MAIGTPVEIGFNSNTSAASAVAITTTIGVAVGDTIIVSASFTDGAAAGTLAVSSVTDSVGNTYAVAVQGKAGVPGGAIIYGQAGTALPSGGTITVTFNISASSRSTATAHTVSGIDPSPLDKTASTVFGNTTSPTATTAATTQADELIWGLISSSNAVATTFTPGSGYNALDKHGTGTGNTTSAVTYPHYRIASTTGTQTVGGTMSSASRVQTLAATFKGGVPAVSASSYAPDRTIELFTPPATSATVRNANASAPNVSVVAIVPYTDGVAQRSTVNGVVAASVSVVAIVPLTTSIAQRFASSTATVATLTATAPAGSSLTVRQATSGTTAPTLTISAPAALSAVVRSANSAAPAATMTLLAPIAGSDTESPISSSSGTAAVVTLTASAPVAASVPQRVSVAVAPVVTATIMAPTATSVIDLGGESVVSTAPVIVLTATVPQTIGETIRQAVQDAGVTILTVTVPVPVAAEIFPSADATALAPAVSVWITIPEPGSVATTLATSTAAAVSLLIQARATTSVILDLSTFGRIGGAERFPILRPSATRTLTDTESRLTRLPALTVTATRTMDRLTGPATRTNGGD